MFTLNIETSNAAFQDDAAHHEIARILRDLAERFDNGVDSGTVKDTNGNTVGSFALMLEPTS